MSEANASDNATSARDEVVNAVVTRVNSYQDTAEEGVLEKELRSALDEAGVEVSDDELTDLVSEIENGEWTPS
jgi:hypothetical protein